MNTFINVVFRKILYKIPLKFLLLLLCIGAVLFASVKADVYLIQGGDTQDITNYNGDIYLELGDNISFSIDDSGGDDLMYNFTASCPSCLSCPSTGEILSGYILESEIDSLYCENNNLCPVYTGDCEDSTGVNWSSLYINNIQHVGGSNIYISIPEEIGWNYFYYNDNFNLSISGSVHDYEKLDQVKSVQSYIPSTDDFSHIIGGFGPFGALLVGVLFVVFVFYLIKKIF